MKSTTFVVDGPPQPKERPRYGANGHWYTPKATKDYEKTVAACGQVAGLRPGGGEYRVEILLWFQDRRRRDVDNVVKAIMDGLNGIAFVDDSQVVEMLTRRDIDPENPRAQVTVELLNGKRPIDKDSEH